MKAISLEVAEKIRNGALRAEQVEWNEEDEEGDDDHVLFSFLIM